MKRLVKSLAGAAALTAGLVFSLPAAALQLITYGFGPDRPPPNDCSGLFGGTGGVVCDVGFALNPAEPISPIIAKHDYVEASGAFVKTTNPGFTTVTGDEFSILFNPDTLASGSWTYEQGTGDPDVRYWVAKDGEGFRLHWYIPDDKTCTGVTYTAECLKLAVSVTTGTWSTLGKDLSHLTWYDTKGLPPEEIPAPATLALLGLGLVGLGVTRRRKIAR